MQLLKINESYFEEDKKTSSSFYNKLLTLSPDFLLLCPWNVTHTSHRGVIEISQVPNCIYYFSGTFMCQTCNMTFMRTMWSLLYLLSLTGALWLICTSICGNFLFVNWLKRFSTCSESLYPDLFQTSGVKGMQGICGLMRRWQQSENWSAKQTEMSHLMETASKRHHVSRANSLIAPLTAVVVEWHLTGKRWCYTLLIM